MAGDAGFILFYVFRCARGYDAAAFFAAAGAHVDDVVGVTDDVEIMFDDDDRRAPVEEGLEDAKEDLDVQGMKADARFIEDEEGRRLGSPHFAGQFQALGFAAGKTGRFFAEGQVTQTEAAERCEPLRDALPFGAKGGGVVDIHGHDFRQRPGYSFFIGQFNGRCGRCVTRAVTGRAGDMYVREKLDVEADGARAVTVGTAQGARVVREIFGLVAFFFGVRRFSIELSQLVVNAGIGRDGGADVDADGRGVNELYLGECRRCRYFLC